MDRIKLLNARGVLHAWKGEWREAEEDLRDALSMADCEPYVDPVALRSVVNNYARVLHKNHRRREVRAIEPRAAVLDGNRTDNMIVDMADLLARRKATKK